MNNFLASLENERNVLLNEWVRADDDEKVSLLLRIMDIDEQLDGERNRLKSSGKKVV